MPSADTRRLIASLEDQAALINRYMDALVRSLRRASAVEATAIQQELAYQTRELARVHAERAAAQQRLAATEGKQKKGGGA